MVFISPQRTLLLFLTAGIFQTNAFPADGAPNSLLPTFTLLGGNGGSETGRCTGTDLENLKASYEDMCLMARSARDEIDFLTQQAALTEGDGPPKPADNAQVPVDNWKRWHRTRETYVSLFGADPFVKRGDPPGPKNPGDFIDGHKRFVRNFYDDVVNQYCGGAPAPDKSTLVCTDADFKFIQVGNVDPGDPQGRNIEVTNPQCTNIDGVWYSQNMPPGNQYDNRAPPRESGDGPVCDDPNHLAVVVRKWRAVFFCKDGLDTNVHKVVTIQDVRDKIKPASRRYKKLEDHEIVLQALTMGQLTRLDDVKRVGGEIMPVTWLHEMHHLLTRSTDEKAVDKTGNRIRITINEYNSATNQYEDHEADEKAYGYDLARDLALHNHVNAMVNPENVAFFGLAMFFSEFDWSRGFAMPLKEPK
ncbi:uncharacterized protein CC84DRAFT_1173219 [Paraphaeosphaeria sporulosa]|uniref:Lysine-specific metallo-endopeptidase domain-containing protein n=1 Tax=Paraphaeosphaeria sporulosa TaxID=1460663 RepID=A0A177CTN1_9PLEO|nr:uncharacterized protein CC84DRAFT_1173219 [Paraphaeosphaeria sporulosa]OAG10894.1 hypothetical protein CC84DRAFT_1173219 [Paraphaeosphaeria sporulosa]